MHVSIFAIARLALAVISALYAYYRSLSTCVYTLRYWLFLLGADHLISRGAWEGMVFLPNQFFSLAEIYRVFND